MRRIIKQTGGNKTIKFTNTNLRTTTRRYCSQRPQRLDSPSPLGLVYHGLEGLSVHYKASDEACAYISQHFNLGCSLVLNDFNRFKNGGYLRVESEWKLKGESKHG